MGSETIVVSVVVPVFNGGVDLERLLDALAAQDDAPPHEVLVVDNASTDGSAERADAHPLHPRVVREPQRGSYAARNTGIRHAAGSVLAFVDADCVPEPGWLRCLAAPLLAGDADLVGGDIVADLPPEASVWQRYDAACYLNQRHQVEADGFAATANFAVLATVLDNIGLFDDELVSGGDYELCRRAVAAGYRLGFVAEARVSHRPRAGLVETWRLHRRLGAGWAALARRGKRPPAWRDPALRVRAGWVAAQSERLGARLRIRRLLPVHVIASVARWVGRLTGG